MEKIEIINSFKSMFPNIDEDVITMLYDQYGENLTDILLNLSNDEVTDEVINDNKDKVTQISNSSTTKDEGGSETKSKKKMNIMSLLGSIYKSNNSNSNNSFDYHKLN